MTKSLQGEGKPLFFEYGTAFFHMGANIGNCFEMVGRFLVLIIGFVRDFSGLFWRGVLVFFSRRGRSGAETRGRVYLLSFISYVFLERGFSVFSRAEAQRPSIV